MDQILIDAKNGDERAIEQLVSDYKGLIRSLSNKFYLVGGDKDDLLQEGMLGLFYAINRYDEEKGSFPAFVQLCVFRQILTAIKRDNSVKQKALSNYVELDLVTHIVDGEDGPLESLIKKEYYNHVLKAAEEYLSPIERRVLSLFAEGYSYDDIAARLGKSHKAVDGALQRARKKLIEHTN